MPMPSLDRISLARPRGSTVNGSNANAVADDLARDSAVPIPLSVGNAVGKPENMDAKIRTVSVQKPRRESAVTSSSKYSSGVSSLTGWGDPGPDLGPGSASSSLRGFVGYGNEDGLQGWDQMQPGSPDSTASSKGGVGKAM